MSMKKLVEVEGEGFTTLLGQRITVFCASYIYTGILEGVNDEYVKLNDASIVYETGAFNDKNWKDAQKVPNSIYIMKNMIEMFTVLK